jgi:hypothetical protein
VNMVGLYMSGGGGVIFRRAYIHKFTVCELVLETPIFPGK